MLELYDRAVRPDASEEYRDVANATALLWRLRRDGVDVGRRWWNWPEVARRQCRDTTLLFATLHRLPALVAVGDHAAAAATVAAIEAAAQLPCEQGHVAAEVVGLPLARTIAATEPRKRAEALQRAAVALGMLGGSHAQRHLFVRILADRTTGRGDADDHSVLHRAWRGLKCRGDPDGAPGSKLTGQYGGLLQ